MSHAKTFNYTFDKQQFENTTDAAEYARDLMLEEWEPYHWHLDMVGESEKYYTVSFTAMIEGWDGNDSTPLDILTQLSYNNKVTIERVGWLQDAQGYTVQPLTPVYHVASGGRNVVYPSIKEALERIAKEQTFD